MNTADPAAPEISIVLPAYNERESLPIVVERAFDVLPRLVSTTR